MAITGLVLTLSEDPTERAKALEKIECEPGVTLGDPAGARFPVVVDTPSTREDRDSFERLGAIEGVRLVELVCVNFEDSEDGSDDR